MIQKPKARKLSKVELKLLVRWNGVIRAWFVVPPSERRAAVHLVERGLAEWCYSGGTTRPMYRLTSAGADYANRLGGAAAADRKPTPTASKAELAKALCEAVDALRNMRQAAEIASNAAARLPEDMDAARRAEGKILSVLGIGVQT